MVASNTDWNDALSLIEVNIYLEEVIYKTMDTAL